MLVVDFDFDSIAPVLAAGVLKFQILVNLNEHLICVSDEFVFAFVVAAAVAVYPDV